MDAVSGRCQGHDMIFVAGDRWGRPAEAVQDLKLHGMSWSMFEIGQP